jgi:hypothetical protein
MVIVSQSVDDNGRPYSVASCTKELCPNNQDNSKGFGRNMEQYPRGNIKFARRTLDTTFFPRKVDGEQLSAWRLASGV